MKNVWCELLDYGIIVYFCGRKRSFEYAKIAKLEDDGHSAFVPILICVR